MEDAIDFIQNYIQNIIDHAFKGAQFHNILF